MKQLSELVELAKLANIAGQGSPEMVDFRVVANPDTIIAIAEAFRALEQERNALASKGLELCHEAVHIYGKYNLTQMPDIDLADYQTIQEFSDLASKIGTGGAS